MRLQHERRLLLLTDDNFLAEVLGTYTRRDDIDIERCASIADAVREIADGVDGVVVDLAKRGMAGDAIMDLTRLSIPRQIPLLILSAQPRRDVLEFATIVQATDVVSKTEPMNAIAARVRTCMRAPKRRAQPMGGNVEHLGWALA